MRQLRCAIACRKIVVMSGAAAAATEASLKPEDAIDIWAVEDNDGFRNMLERALNQIDGLTCKRSFSSCEQAIAGFREGDPPRVLLLDINLPGMNGLEAIRDIKKMSPQTEVVMLTINEDHSSIMQAICSGATGYLLKTSSLEEIHQSIMEVVRGGAPMSPQIARSVMGLFTRFAPAQNDYGLTQREKGVLQLLVDGFIKKEIAERLNLSYHTIDKHVRGIYSKLQVHSLSAAVAKAVKNRLF